MNTNSKLLEDTSIWKTYIAGLPADSSRSAWVHQLYNSSVIYLKDIRLNFPNYTLHDETHVLNVLDAMAGILGNQISQLSTGEMELLILAACLHDLGMVYTEDEAMQCFADKRQTHEFLRLSSPELLGCPAEEWPENIRQWYLRWLHPFRLPKVLQNEAWTALLSTWPAEIAPKRCVLAVCQAHGESPEEFSTGGNMEYLAASDVDPLFCTLLLRLADLLDFDDTRAPKVLYSYVICNEESRKEWEKHQASGGFRYPDSPSTAKLPYKAHCTSPGIEHTIRDFLDWIDSELNFCARLQQRCHQNWQRSFPFPQSIERKEIESEGYLSGDFQMTMDQTRVMELLTGEQLYHKNNVFIRELLQNSIDATLLRLKEDRDFSLEDARIDLWEWNDKDGNIWFRIDDQGNGMTLGMLQRYFLRIGNSYYTSQELKRDLRDHGQTGDYQSISRFGIGFLSCFLCGTFAEVSTLYFDPRKNAEECDSAPSRRTPDYGLRLQVTGLQGYYTLKSQAEQHAADSPMPAPEDYRGKAVPDLERDGYRAKPGTSISIKLDPGRLGAINLRGAVREYLCCAKIPVYYNGDRIGRTYQETMDAVHKSEGKTVYELTPELQEKFDKCFPACIGQYPKVSATVIPLDTEENQMLPDLSGAFIKYDTWFENSPCWQANNRNYKITISIESYDSILRIRAQNTDFSDYFLSWDSFIAGHSHQEIKDLNAALEKLTCAPSSEDELGEAWKPFAEEKIPPVMAWQLWLDSSQTNTLTVPLWELGVPTSDTLTGGKNHALMAFSYRGIIAGKVKTYLYSEYRIGYTLLLLLDNELRPTVKASRSEISDIPLELIVAIRGILGAWDVALHEHFRILGWETPPLPAWRKLHGTKLEDWLLKNLRDYFEQTVEQFSQPAFPEDMGALCIGGSWRETESVLQTFLMASLQDTHQMKVNYEEGQIITFVDKAPDGSTDSYDLFPPMMFCLAATPASRRFLCSKDCGLRRCITADHPYVAWFLKHAAVLNGYYNRQFQQIVRALLQENSNSIINTCNDIREQLLSLPEHHGIDIAVCPQLSEDDFWAPTDI